MGALTGTQIGAFLFAVITQVVGVTFLVKTRGFTHAGWTAATIVVLITSFFSLAWLLNNGAKLNILLPILAATVPLFSVMIGVFFYGEAASAMKIALLVGACVLIGIAAAVG
ncbi:SMR family transporter [Croceicoccus ponticola]|nr:SMR family transporter [Croceicoccus ponticola]